MSNKLPAFKAYDIRGKMPTELNPTLAYHIGRGLAVITGDKTAILGMDSRLTSPELMTACAAGLTSMGVSCQTLGLCGTEEVYHAAGAGHSDIGIMVTASHNPMDYNGMKFVGRGGIPFTSETHLVPLEAYVREHMSEDVPASFAAVPHINLREEYVNHLLSFVDTAAIKPQTVVINAGNGAAGPTADAILAKLPQLNVIRINHEPDGTFPNGIPNPLLPSNRIGSSKAVVAHKADLGIAWDGDFDRCFLYDEKGQFVSNYYLAGLLAHTMLEKNPGASIVHDPRLFWDTEATIRNAGGTPVIAKVGHSNIKPMMRSHNAPFAGEISGHFYFRDFFFCDTGMLPWLLTLQYLGQTGQTLGEALASRAASVAASEEINFQTPTPAKEYLEGVKAALTGAGEMTTIDGFSIATPEWRANIRASNTEPLLRLNVEAKSAATLQSQLEHLTHLIETNGAQPAGDH
ncbi:MAG: phosphomannomutase [Pseudomonas fluorescens]|nr:MAG: phosphomannomutase [Pseudomonas fluorescens]